MAWFEAKPEVKLEVTLRLHENEARALLALSAYGTDELLKVFYKHLGSSCLKPHELGLKNLLSITREILPPILSRADKARKAFSEKPAAPQPESEAQGG